MEGLSGPYLLEAPNLPPGGIDGEHPLMSTNSMWIRTETLRPGLSLPWHVVTKTIEGRRQFQFEQFIGDALPRIGALPLYVPRTGPSGRFAPLKVPDDLRRHGDGVRRALAQRGTAFGDRPNGAQGGG